MNIPTLNVMNFGESNVASSSVQQPVFSFANAFDSTVLDEIVTIKDGEENYKYNRSKRATENMSTIKFIKDSINVDVKANLYAATFVYEENELFFDPDSTLDGNDKRRAVTLLDVLDSRTSTAPKLDPQKAIVLSQLAKEYGLPPENTLIQVKPEDIVPIIKNVDPDFSLDGEYAKIVYSDTKSGGRTELRSYKGTTIFDGYIQIYATEATNDEDGLTAYAKETGGTAYTKNLNEIFTGSEWTYDSKTNKFTYVTKE